MSEGADSARTTEVTQPVPAVIERGATAGDGHARGLPGPAQSQDPLRDTAPESPDRSSGSAPVRPQVRPPVPARPSAGNQSRRGRRAQLSLRRIDPRSAFVLSLLLSLLLALITIVAAFVLYSVLERQGIPSSINTAIADVRGGSPVLTSARFVGSAALLAAVNVVLITVLGTAGAVLYNICASFTGGVAVTLTERE